MKNKTHPNGINLYQVRIEHVKKTDICFVMSILFSLILNSCNTLVGLRSEEGVGKYILSHTPVGTSKDDVKKFIKKRKYEYSLERNHSAGKSGVTLPADFPIDEYIIPYERGVGSSFIEVFIASYFFRDILVMCKWIFDDDEKLFIIQIEKYYEGP